MAELLPLASAASALIAAGTQIHTLVTKYSDAPSTLRQLDMHCRTLGFLAADLHRFAQEQQNASPSPAHLTFLADLTHELAGTLNSVKDCLPRDFNGFRARIGTIWDEGALQTKLELIRDLRGNISLLLNSLQVHQTSNDGTVQTLPPAVARSLPSTSQLHNFLYGGGKDLTKICSLPLRRVTDDPKIQKHLKTARARIFVFVGPRRIAQQHRKKTQALHEAIANGRHLAVCALLEAGQDPNALLSDKVSALHRAIVLSPSDNAYAIASVLACYGADQGAKDPEGNTPLIRALIEQRPLKWIMMLCELDEVATSARATRVTRATTFHDRKGETVLHCAIRHNLPVEYLTVLLHYGADVQALSHAPGLSPLGLAVQLGQLRAVRKLLDHGAVLRREQKMTPIQRACRADHFDVVDLLCRYDGPLNEDQNLERPLYVAVAHKSFESARVLLDFGANADDIGCGIDGPETPLFRAVSQSDMAIAILLLDRGANVDGGTKNSSSPLYVAVKNNEKGLADVLLKHGANVELGKGYITPLMLAVEADLGDMINLLHSHGADIHAIPADPSRSTLLSSAAAHESRTAVRVLIAKGADPNQADARGMTPLMAAAKRGHVEIVKMLVHAGANVKHVDHDHCDVLGWACLAGGPEVADILLEHGAELESSDVYCVPSLLRAAAHGRDATVKMLLARGVHVDTSWKTHSRGTWTALTMAISCGQISTVRLLWAMGAAQCMDEPDKPSLLCLAARHPAMVKLLVERGYNVNHRDAYGGTPLHQAVVIDVDPFEGVNELYARQAWSFHAEGWSPVDYFVADRDAPEGGLVWMAPSRKGLMSGTPADVAARLDRQGVAVVLRGENLTMSQSAGRYWAAAMAAGPFKKGAMVAAGIGATTAAVLSTQAAVNLAVTLCEGLAARLTEGGEEADTTFAMVQE
ncbi:hypothetical protein ACHAQH_002839 [Verticillium albo-atrum]